MDIKTVCLGVLMLGDQSGYEIRKQFEQGPFAHFNQASFGSIYPALKRLLNDGLVSCRPVTQQGKPDKKVYSLTSSGRKQLRDALHGQPAPDKSHSDFLFMLFFAEQLDPDHLQAIYTDYLDGFKANLAYLEALDDTGIPEGRQFVRALGRNYYRSMVDFLDQNRDALFNSLDVKPLPGRLKKETCS